MGTKADMACCAPGETPRSYEESVELGHNRRYALIRFCALASALLCLTGILTPLIMQSSAGMVAGDRLLWVGALLGTPLMLGYVRRLLATRRPPWQLIVAGGLLLAGLLGYPVVPAAAVAGILGVRALRSAQAQYTKACPAGCTQDCCATTISASVSAADARRAG